MSSRLPTKDREAEKREERQKRDTRIETLASQMRQTMSDALKADPNCNHSASPDRSMNRPTLHVIRRVRRRRPLGQSLLLSLPFLVLAFGFVYLLQAMALVMSRAQTSDKNLLSITFDPVEIVWGFPGDAAFSILGAMLVLVGLAWDPYRKLSEKFETSSPTELIRVWRPSEDSETLYLSRAHVQQVNYRPDEEHGFDAFSHPAATERGLSSYGRLTLQESSRLQRIESFLTAMFMFAGVILAFAVLDSIALRDGVSGLISSVALIGTCLLLPKRLDVMEDFRGRLITDSLRSSPSWRDNVSNQNEQLPNGNLPYDETTDFHDAGTLTPDLYKIAQPNRRVVKQKGIIRLAAAFAAHALLISSSLFFVQRPSQFWLPAAYCLLILGYALILRFQGMPTTPRLNNEAIETLGVTILGPQIVQRSDTELLTKHVMSSLIHRYQWGPTTHTSGSIILALLGVLMYFFSGLYLGESIPLVLAFTVAIVAIYVLSYIYFYRFSIRGRRDTLCCNNVSPPQGASCPRDDCPKKMTERDQDQESCRKAWSNSEGHTSDLFYAYLIEIQQASRRLLAETNRGSQRSDTAPITVGEAAANPTPTNGSATTQV